MNVGSMQARLVSMKAHGNCDIYDNHLESALINLTIKQKLRKEYMEQTLNEIF